MVSPEILREDFVDEVIRVVLVHLDFFQDDPAFLPDVLHIEDRPQHQVAEHVHRDGHVLVKHFHVEANALLWR